MWKPVNDYEGLYEVSDTGIVRSIRRSGSKGISCKSHVTKGYLVCWLSKHNKVKRFSVHRLVALAFIPNPENKPQVNHKDGNKKNNYVGNLEWVTKAEQEAHKMGVLGEDGKGEKNSNYGMRKKLLYPSEKLRNRLCKLGVPSYKHNIAELGEMLPVEALDGDILGYIPTQLQICKQDVGWYCVYKNVSDGEYEDRDVHECVADTLADCLAKMLIYLVENKLITL